MVKRLFAVTALFATVLTIGLVKPAVAADKNAPVVQKTVYVLFDNGVTESLSTSQTKAQTQLAAWMDKDLVRVFDRYKKTGYQAKLIEKRAEFKPQPGSYLLAVKITKYNAGNKAARIFGGFGAGGVTLDIHYELFADGKTPLIAKDDSVFSGREWINAARKLNENTAKAVTEQLK